MAEFQRSLQRFFLALNQLMESPLEGPTLLSQVRRGRGRGGQRWCGGTRLARGRAVGAMPFALRVAAARLRPLLAAGVELLQPPV